MEHEPSYQNWWYNNADVAWPSGGANTAVFGGGSGTAGTVTVSGTGVAVVAMTFNAAAAGACTIAGGSITLASSPTTVTMNANAAVGAILSGGGGLTVAGSGTLNLTASNAYSGTTTVSGGVLQLSNSGALPGGNLTLNGGVVELAAGNFARGLGSGTAAVQFTANGGGFAALGANDSVNLSSSAALTWGGGGSFMPSGGKLMLGRPAADSTIDFQNPFDLASGTQTVLVTAGSGTAAVDARLCGVLSGSGGLTIAGDGTLELTASNIGTGPTTSPARVLRLSNSGGLAGRSNLTLDGGVVELAAGDFTGSLGTAAGQVQFTANGGGFAAVGANRVVNLAAARRTLTWGSGGFLPSGGTADARHPARRCHARFSKPDQPGQRPANRPGDRRFRHGGRPMRGSPASSAATAG